MEAAGRPRSRAMAVCRLIRHRGSRSKYGNTKLNAVKGRPIMPCLLSTIISQMSGISTKLPSRNSSPDRVRV